MDKILVRFVAADLPTPSLTIECPDPKVALTVQKWLTSKGADTACVVTRTSTKEILLRETLFCDLCGKLVIDESFDVVTRNPRHKTCIPF